MGAAAQMDPRFLQAALQQQPANVMMGAPPFNGFNPFAAQFAFCGYPQPPPHSYNYFMLSQMPYGFPPQANGHFFHSMMPQQL
eukprot:786930-Pleurochrysis_carterae.AAC.1